MKPNKKKAILALKFSSSMLNPKIHYFKDFVYKFSLIFCLLIVKVFIISFNEITITKKLNVHNDIHGFILNII